MRLLGDLEISQVLDQQIVTEIVAAAFEASSVNTTDGFRRPVLGNGASLHVVSGADQAGHFVTKLNVTASGSARRGIIVVQDAASADVLAVLDSKLITLLRTAAVSALALRLFTVGRIEKLCFLGAGVQAETQIRAMSIERELGEVMIWSRDSSKAKQLSQRLSAVAECRAIDNIADGAASADVLVTCTRSSSPLFQNLTHFPNLIVAVGADSPGKRELPTSAYKGATFVVDSFESCAAYGELHHALEEEMTSPSAVHVLGDVLSGRVPLEQLGSRRIIVDTTGTAVQDAAAALLALSRATELGLGSTVDLWMPGAIRA